MLGRQKIENHREPKSKYSIETQRSGIVTWRNCNAPRSRPVDNKPVVIGQKGSNGNQSKGELLHTSSFFFYAEIPYSLLQSDLTSIFYDLTSFHFFNWEQHRFNRIF